MKRTFEFILFMFLQGCLLAGGAWGQASDPVYAALRKASLQGSSVEVHGLHLRRDALELVLEEGSISYAEPVQGRSWLGVFRGKGHARLVPGTPIELEHLRLLMDEPKLEALEDRFETAVLAWTDATAEEIQAHSKPEAGAQNPEAAKRLGEFHDFLRKDLRENLELRLLTDLYRSKPEGLFVVWLAAERSSKLLYILDPHGVFPRDMGSETFALLDGRTTEGGLWYMGSPAGDGQGLGFVPLRYQIETRIDKGERLDSRTRLKLKASMAGERVVQLELTGRQRVAEAWLLPERKPLPWIQEDEKEGSELGLVLPEPVAAGQELELELAYQGDGVLSDTGEGNFSVGARSNWYPSLGYLAPAAQYELKLCAPKGREIVSIGDRGKTWEEKGSECSAWSSPAPLAVAGFNYGKFKKLEQKDADSGLLLEAYRNPGTPDFIKDLQGRLEAMERENSMEASSDEGMFNSRVLRPSLHFDTGALFQDALVDAVNSARVYTRYFGPLPFGRVAITQQAQADFGQSWPTLVYLPFTAFLDSYQRHQLGISDEGNTDFVQAVGPHELAHQWWGHLVGWNSYHDQWISEGFAEFSAGLEMEKAVSLERVREFWRDERVMALQKPPSGLPPALAGPIWLGQRLNTHRTLDAYRLVYSKGAFVLHMLRMMMQGPHGEDDAFIAMMKDFTTAFRGRRASTGDFQAVVERHMSASMDLEHNRKMDWFFRQWVYGMQIPAYRLQVEFQPAPGGKLRLKGSLRQENVSEDFRMPVPLYLAMPNGRTVRVAQIPCVGTAPVPLDVVLPISQTPTALVNANFDILAFDPS